MSTLVKPEFGPTLLEILRPRPRWVRTLVLGAGALVLAAGVFVLAGGTRPPETEVVVRGERTFNLAHGPQLERVPVAGALLALRRTRDGEVLDAYTVRPLTLPPYQGSASGVLPLVAGEHIERLRARHPDLVLGNPPEARTRVNDAPGYQVTYRFPRGGRSVYARDVFLLPDVDGLREGVVIELRGTFPTTPNVDRTGAVGPLKKPLRSFRFGTERAGGV